MDKRAISNDIKQAFDGASMINTSQVARYLGVCRDTARVFLKDIEYCPVGNEKKYLALDIAKKIYENRDA